MHTIFVTATNTDVGKTYTSLQLLEYYAAAGWRIGAFKPIETGVSHTPSDASALLALCHAHNPDFRRFTLDDICPLQFTLPAAPCVAAACEKFDLSPLFEKFALLKQACDILIVEGAGGPMVPIHTDYFMVDLISRFDATPLLVTHDRLGCINDTLTALSLLQSRGLQPLWCVNLRDEATFMQLTHPFYHRYFGNYYRLQHDLEALALRLVQ